MGVFLFMEYREEEAISDVTEGPYSLKKRVTQYIERFTYQVTPETRKKIKYCTFGVISTCIFFFIVIGILVPLLFEFNDQYHYDIPEQNKLIKFAREYQLSLDVSPITNRSDFVESWVHEWNKASTYIQLDPTGLISATRTQFYLDTTQCNLEQEFRVRNFGSGDVVASLDIKSSDTSKSTCNSPFWPQDIFVANSTQKCERDIHESGFSKYSRISKIHFDEVRSFNTCVDLATYFPWAFAELRPFQWNLPVVINEKRQVQYWWSGEIKGTEKGVKYKLESSLRYHNIEEREEESTPSLGELSIRIFSNDGGYSDDWNQEIIEDVENAWQFMKNKFSKHY